jgi:hypothetical protein
MVGMLVAKNVVFGRCTQQYSYSTYIHNTVFCSKMIRIQLGERWAAHRLAGGGGVWIL